MITLIVTASDELYTALSERVRAEGYLPERAADVLRGFEQAAALASHRPAPSISDRRARDQRTSAQLAQIIVDMSLHAADTLLETLHSREETSAIPRLAVRCNSQPFPPALRRLCSSVIEADVRAVPGEQMGGDA
jgi:hypothetical protein